MNNLMKLIRASEPNLDYNYTQAINNAFGKASIEEK